MESEQLIQAFAIWVMVLVPWSLFAVFAADVMGSSLDEWLERDNERGITYLIRTLAFLAVCPIIAVLLCIYLMVRAIPPAVRWCLETK